jgi:hypothetical protein
MYFWSYIDQKKKKIISILREHLALKIKTEGIVTNIIQVAWISTEQGRKQWISEP